MHHVHFIGIGGTGMGPLAKVFLEKGCRVSGSDLVPSETTDLLHSLGAQVFIGHHSSHVVDCDAVIYSSAIPPHNPELSAAREMGLAVHHRSEILAELLNENTGIAIAGAHGKTTITSMAAWILEQNGFDPTVLIGARFSPFGPGAKFGRGKVVVAEADESDGSFLRYRPSIAVVTSIEPDHLENYHGAFAELAAAYKDFLANVRPGGVAVLGIDDPTVQVMAASLTGTWISYGFDPQAHWRGEVLELAENRARFRVFRGSEDEGVFELMVPGRHNVANALAALAVCQRLGVEAAAAREALRSFSGAQRRFEIVGECRGILVVDDYAHHPTEVAATIAAAKAGWTGRRVVVVFQPHRYSRTQALFNEFVNSFAQADLVLLTDIYAPPPEEPILGISAELMAVKMEEQGISAHWVGAQKRVAAALARQTRAGDLVITMGAGPIWQSGREFISSFLPKAEAEDGS